MQYKPAAPEEADPIGFPAMAAPDGNTFTQYAGLGNMQRLEQPAGTNLPLGVGGGTRDGRARSTNGALRNTISQLLGDNIQLNMTRAVESVSSVPAFLPAAGGVSLTALFLPQSRCDLPVGAHGCRRPRRRRVWPCDHCQR